MDANHIVIILYQLETLSIPPIIQDNHSSSNICFFQSQFQIPLNFGIARVKLGGLSMKKYSCV